MSLPGYPYGAPPGPAKRRWWLIGVVSAWVVVLAGLAVWSVRHDPATVPDQRDIAAALPVLERATGAMFAAADGTDRVVVLGDLHLIGDCRITPVRSGVEATRDVTVYVAADRALDALDAIAAALPAEYRAESADNAASNRIGLHADAGGFVAIDADSPADAQVLTLEASTGCRPTASGVDLEPADSPTRDLPAVLTAVLRALGAPTAGQATVREVGCPEGGVGRTYLVDGVAAPKDLGRSLQGVVAGATVVRAESQGWAYRTGSDSVAVTVDGSRARVSATLACH